MNRNVLLLVFVFLSQVSLAQTPVATPVSPSKKGSVIPVEIARAYFCCPQCDFTAKAARSCPVHQAQLIRVGDWYCPRDGKSFAAAGKCPKDKADLIRMEMKYQTLTPKPDNLKKTEPIKK